MTMQQARSLAFGLRPLPFRHSLSATPNDGRLRTAGILSEAATATYSRCKNSSTGGGGGSTRRRARRLWWGVGFTGRSLKESNTASISCRLTPQHQREQLFLPAAGTLFGRLMSSSRPDETVAGTTEEARGGGGEGEGGEEEDILRSLAEELVWKGDREDEEDDDDGEDCLDEMDLESLGISMMDDETAEEVQEQLRREWGSMSVQNNQNAYQIDTAELQSKLSRAMEVLGCQAWDVGVVLTTDKEVSQLNRQYRGMDSSTDILSFSNHDMSDNPGVLPKVRFPAEMDLGDMYISLAYVDRQIKRDMLEQQAAAVAAAAAKKGGGDGDGAVAATSGGFTGAHVEDHEWWDSERGVSGAMSRVFDIQVRTSMLLVHGLIHLMGYDHETAEDYEAMVALEEEVLRAVFGGESVAGASPPRTNLSQASSST